LRYLNLSGNKRLEIKPAKKATPKDREHDPADTSLEGLAGFTGLANLRVLGLMDVTTTFIADTNAIPDDNDDRRVRTSLSEVNNMQYGIADCLGDGDYVSMFDLVVPSFRDRREEALFAMFGRAQAPAANSRVSKFLRDNFAHIFQDALERLEPQRESIPDALRRAFLRLNWAAHDFLFGPGGQGQGQGQSQSQGQGAYVGRKNSSSVSGSISGSSAAPTQSQPPQPQPQPPPPPLSPMDTTALGASGVVAFVQGSQLYVANAGNALAVVSRRGHAEPVSTKHEPFHRGETERIRAAEGWVSPKGLVNDETAVSRSFGYYHLVPVVNAKPDIAVYPLTEVDEFVIIANSGLWDYVSFQTAVDIARTAKHDPMIAAQKLRDFAISYGAEGATMIMVISTPAAVQARSESLVDEAAFGQLRRRKGEVDRGIIRLQEEIPPPLGNLALVFTDIRNSTLLWDTNAGMPTAIRMHHTLLRRELRLCGGYEVKTEGDAFMVAFQSVSAALLWCLTVQMRLLEESWPREILECAEGRERRARGSGEVVARGLSVRMGIHCGTPICELDITTHRMDYYGPMVNRSARVMASAAGGQIMVTADVAAEIRARLLGALDAEPRDELLPELRAFDVSLVHVGEFKLKGLEMPETLSLVYPRRLLGRHELLDEPDEPVPPPAPSPESTPGDDADEPVVAVDADVLCTAEQVRELAALGVRLQALAAGHIIRPPPRRGSVSLLPEAPNAASAKPPLAARVIRVDPTALAPGPGVGAGEDELLAALEYVLLGLEAAADALVRRVKYPELDALLRMLHANEGVLSRAHVAALVNVVQGKGGVSVGAGER
jgi:adenylate cyclase